jgi:hypothetical protein
MVPTAPQQNSFPAAAGIGGVLHGGNQPISGALIQLYAAGTTGYGSAATLYATTTSSNDGTGSFFFNKSATNTGPASPSSPSWGCPATGDPQIYITAAGGNTQGSGTSTNSAAAFVVALGKCSGITGSTFVNLNEVTTVATMAALQQYFNPGTEQLGSPASTQALQGFANGVATIGNLAQVSQGIALGSTTVSATPAGASSAVTVTLTSEIKKLNTIADVLAACVNSTTSSGSACASLFAAATPPSAAVTSQPAQTFSAATDTLQAAYYMLSNPTSGNSANMNTLFNLQVAAAPFQPVLTTEPTDWTLGIRYSSTSPCTAGTFLGGPFDLVADATGNIWISGNSTNGNLMEINSVGTPMVCTLGTSVASSKSLTIDAAGSVWIGSNTASNMYRYDPNAQTSTTWPTLNIPYAVAADGNGNVFYTSAAGSEIDEFIAAATSTTPTTASKIGKVGSGSFFLTPDTAGNIWVVQSAASASLYEVYPSTKTTAGNYLAGYQTSIVASTTANANVTNLYGIAAGLGGTIEVINSANSSSTVGNTFGIVTPNATAGSTASVSDTAQGAGGIATGRGAAVDGAGNVWTVSSAAATGNYVTGATTSGYFMANEFSASGTALSPTGTSTATASNGGFQKDATIFASAPRGVAIDPTGNVWIGSNSSDGSGNGVVEIVGVAVPVVTPIAAALAAGSSNGNAVSKP